jgi:hypothetical protein
VAGWVAGRVSRVRRFSRAGGMKGAVMRLEMVLKGLGVTAVVGLMASISAGCGTASDASPEANKGERAMKADTPEALGDAAGQIYKDTMEAIVRDLEPKPEAADAKAKVTALLEDAQQRLVDLGKKREAMAPGDKASFDQKLMTSMQGLKGATFDKYAALASHYRGVDREVGNLIAQANVLTQYANFELLEQQSPAEAQKYGIE